MRPPGSYKLSYRNRAAPRRVDPARDPLAVLEALGPMPGLSSRTQRLVESLRHQILEAGRELRIRKIFDDPREVYRIELHVPELNYVRTTLLDGELLEELLQFDDVRAAVADSVSG